MLGLMSGVPAQSAHFDGSSGPKGPNELTFAFGVSPALAVLENGANAAALAGLVRPIAGENDYIICLGAGNITQWAYALPGELAALDQQGA